MSETVDIVDANGKVVSKIYLKPMPIKGAEEIAALHKLHKEEDAAIFAAINSAIPDVGFSPFELVTFSTTYVGYDNLTMVIKT